MIDGHIVLILFLLGGVLLAAALARHMEQVQMMKSEAARRNGRPHQMSTEPLDEKSIG